MSMETDIRAKKNEAKCHQLGTKVAELEAKIEAMSGPQDTTVPSDATKVWENTIRPVMQKMAEKINDHKEILRLMANGLDTIDERLRAHKVPKKHSKKKQNNKRKRAA